MIGFFPTNEVVQRGVSNFNANLTAADIARVQAAVQEAALREQAKQNQAQQSFQQQQLANTNYFNRGRLANDAAQIEASKIIAADNAKANAAWRQAQLQPRIDQVAADAAADEQQKANWATQADNLAKARNEHSSLTADLSKIVAMETAQAENAKLPNPPGMFARSGLRPDLYDPSVFKQEATAAGGRSLGGVNFQGAKTRLQTRLKELEDYINSAPKGLDTMLAKTPQGWMSTFRTVAPAGTNGPPAYLNALTNTPTASATNGAVPYFGGTATNSPAIAPQPAAAPAGRAEPSGARVTMRFPDGAERTFPASNVEEVMRRFGATVVETPVPKQMIAVPGMTTLPGNGAVPYFQ